MSLRFICMRRAVRTARLHDNAAQHADRGVDVEFVHGPTRRFDAVVIAEGSRSRTRELVFPDALVEELGLLAAYLTIPRTADDDRQWRIHVGGRGRILRPQTERAQTFVPRKGHPRVEWHRTMLRTGLRLLGGPLGRTAGRVRTLIPPPPVDTITLPDYPTRTPASV